MDYSKLKCFFGIAVCLAILLAPFALEISPDGKVLAFSSRSKNKHNAHAIKSVQGGKKKAEESQTSWSEYKPLTENNNDSPPAPHPVKGQSYLSEYKPLTENNTDNPPAPHPVPEPTTMLLVGSGLVGLAALRKKFKK